MKETKIKGVGRCKSKDVKMTKKNRGERAVKRRGRNSMRVLKRKDTKGREGIK